VIQAADGEECDAGTPTANCTAVCEAPAPECPNAFVGGIDLGAAADFAILVLDSPSCTSSLLIGNQPTRVDGDIGVCAGVGGDVKQAKVDGDLIRDTTPPGTSLIVESSFQFSSGHGVLNQDLSAACGAGVDPGDARDASTAASALTCDITLASITAATTFTATTATRADGFTVVCVTGNVSLTKKNITLNGNGSDVFVFNIGGNVNLSSAKLVLSGGVTANHILWNATGNGATVNLVNDATAWSGTWLVPKGSFVLDHAQLTGAAIAGCTARFQSAALVNFCPPLDP
jgi:choice-of-anchor A domain-containing protein